MRQREHEQRLEHERIEHEARLRALKSGQFIWRIDANGKPYVLKCAHCWQEPAVELDTDRSGVGIECLARAAAA